MENNSGIPADGKITYRPTPDLVVLLVKEKQADFRENMQDTITAILRKYFYWKAQAQIRDIAVQLQAHNAIPRYGSSPSQEDVELEPQQIRGPE